MANERDGMCATSTPADSATRTGSVPKPPHTSTTSSVLPCAVACESIARMSCSVWHTSPSNRGTSPSMGSATT